MTETLELGGNIALTGFSKMDGASMIVLKKIIGSYVKGISEKNSDFKKLELILESKDPMALQVVLNTKEEKKSQSTNPNIFIALNECLNQF